MNVRIKGVEKVQKLLLDLPKAFTKEVIRILADEVLGDAPGTAGNKLSNYPRYKFVKRADAYGKVSDAPAGYFSWKQFRYVAAITEGFTKFYKRTGETGRAWKRVEKNSGYTVLLVNESQGAYFTMHDQGQARQPAMVGWRKASEIVWKTLPSAVKQAFVKVRAMMAKKV
jgi:hypothetical protein